MLVDSHCHLNLLDLADLQQDIPGVLAVALAQDVTHFLCVSVTLDDLPTLIQYTREYKNVFTSVGLHPNEQPGFVPKADELARLASDKGVVAIGETGLDYYRTSGDITWQQERFREHIRAAIACQKPLIIHMREASTDTLRILKEEQADKIGGVMHCFTENWEIAQQAIALNFAISFSGIVTFKSASALQEVAKNIPLDQFLVETDSPYLAPIPYRGKQNRPAYVREVAQFIADLREVPFETIAKASTDNFFRLFKQASII